MQTASVKSLDAQLALAPAVDKLELIRWIVELEDVGLLSLLSDLHHTSTGGAGADEFEMTPEMVADMNARADEAEEDIAAGRVYSKVEILSHLGI